MLQTTRSHLVDVVVDLVGYFLELMVGQAEVSLVRVEVGVLPAALGLGLFHRGGQVKGCLQRLGGTEDNTWFSTTGVSSNPKVQTERGTDTSSLVLMKSLSGTHW